MSIATLASGRATASEAAADYRPGVCNIGPEEIARRRRAGHLGVVATLVTLAVLVVIDAPPLARLIVALPAAGAATSYLQAWMKFCVAFGSAGVFNFGRLGEIVKVEDPGARKRDRARSLQIGLGALAIGATVGVTAVVLPI